MLPPLTIDSYAGKLLIASLKATVEQSDAELKSAQKILDDAQTKFDEVKGKHQGYAQLLLDVAKQLNLTDEALSIISPSSNAYTEAQPKSVPKAKEGANAITLQVIRENDCFLTPDQIVPLVFDFYAEGQIKEKTVKNALWELSTNGTIKKQYIKAYKGLVYGLPEWIDEDGKPKEEYMKLLVTGNKVEKDNSNSLFSKTETEDNF